jgi:hypothetical protein
MAVEVHGKTVCEMNFGKGAAQGCACFFPIPVRGLIKARVAPERGAQNRISSIQPMIIHCNDKSQYIHSLVSLIKGGSP